MDQATDQGEQWLSVPGYEGRYVVSDHGRVRSLTRRVDRDGSPYVLQGRVLRATPMGAGYPYVSLRDGASTTKKTVHSLVMLAFVGPPPPGQEIRHLDGDMSNPHLDNLAYGTHAENVEDTIRHGRHSQASKTHCPKGHPYSGENLGTVHYSRGWIGRRCRTCRREQENERKAAGRLA